MMSLYQRVFYGVPVLLAILVISACGSAPPSTAAKAKPKDVRVATVQVEDLTRVIELTGEVEALRGTTLSSLSEGFVRDCPWREGDVVELAADGPTVMVRLDRGLHEADVASARAGLAVAEARLQELIAAPRAEDLEQARTAVAQAEARLAYCASDHQRLQALLAQEAVSTETVEQAWVTKLEAVARLSEARRRLAVLEDGPLPSSRAVAEAQVAEAAARLAVAEARAAERLIEAPFAGIVGAVHMSCGDLVRPGEPLLSMYDPHSLVLRVGVPERLTAELAVGATAEVVFDAQPGRGYELRVERIYPRIEKVSRTRTVELALPADQGLLPGMFARVSLLIARAPEALTLPREALLTMPNGKTRVVVIENGQAHHRRVELGIESQGRVEIRHGLAPGDSVAVAGHGRLQDGQPVRALPAAAASTVPEGPVQ